MDIKTKNGITYHIDEDALGDYEIFESIVAIQQGDVVQVPGTIKALLGLDGYEQMKESVRDPETGRVKTADFMAAFGEVLTLAGQNPSKKK